MITDKNITYVLLLIIPLYWAGGYLYEQGTITHQVIIGLWYLISTYYLLFFIRSKGKSSTGIFLISFILMNLLYWKISPHQRYVIDHKEDTIAILKFIIQPLIIYFPFYILSKKNIITNKMITLMFCFTFVMCYFLYEYTAESIMEMQGSTATTNNIGYQFVTLFPLIFVFFEKRILVAIVYVLSLLLIVFSAKRGAIICFIIETIIFLLLYRKTISPRYRKISVLFIGTTFIALLYYVILLAEDNWFLVRRFEQFQEGNTSGRDEIYSSVLRFWLNSDIFNMIFGNGFFISPEVPGNIEKNYAHQDWLELLAGQGIIGIIVYIFFYISIYKFYFVKKGIMTIAEKFGYLCVLAVWTIKPFFSMTYYDVAAYALVLTLGLIQGRVDRRLLESKIK